MSDDRFIYGRDKKPKKNITLREYLSSLVEGSGRSKELEEAIKLLDGPVIESILAGEKLREIIKEK